MNDHPPDALPTESQDPESTEPPARRLAFSILLIAAGLIAYENSVSGVFVYDDIFCIVENESLRSLEATWNAGPEDVPDGLRRRIVGRWTFAINYAAGGLDVWGYHLVNIVIHITAALLLMGIVRRVLLLPGMPSGLREHSSVLSFCVALLWLIHPIQTESVTYIVQRLESLMGMFFLASLYALLRSHTGRPLLWQSLAVVAGWLCIGTKEVGLMLPPVALLFDRVFLASSWSEVFRKRGVIHALLLTAMIAYFVVGIGRVPYHAERPAAGERSSSWEFLRSQPGVLLHYLKTTFWPRTLCLELLWPIAHDPWEIYGKGALIIAMLATGFSLLRRRPAAGFLIIAFFLILAPSSTIVPLHLAFVHRMYLSLACVVVGVVLLVFWCAERLSRRLKYDDPAGAGAIGVLLVSLPAAIALVLLTRQHNDTYRSRVAVWQNVIAVAPDNYRGRTNLAIALSQAGRHDEAESHYRVVLDHARNFHHGWHNYGLFLHYYRQSPERALPCLKEAVALMPDSARYHCGLASALEDSGDIVAAERSYRRAIEIDPDHYVSCLNLGRILRREQRATEARQFLTRAIESNPAAWRTHHELARLATNQEDHQRAAGHYEDALRCVEGDSSWVLNQELAWLLATSPVNAVRDGQRAMHLAQLAVDIQQSQAICWDTLGAAQAEVGRFDDAIESARKAVALAESSSADTPSVLAMRQRIDLYRENRPYRATDVVLTSASTDPAPNSVEAAP